MCLIAAALNVRASQPLVLLANRDEWMRRPSAAAHWWPEPRGCFGGRDLEAGGSWLLVSDQGRLATLTNDPRRPRAPGQRSRGDLVRRLVMDPAPLPEAMASLARGLDDYAGFHLLGIDWRCPERPGAAVLSNAVDSEPLRAIDDGVFSLSNAPVNTPWPKALHLQRALEQALADTSTDSPDWLSALSWDRPVDGSRAAGSFVSDVPPPAEPLAFPFVPAGSPDGYGTRVSTVVTLDPAGMVSFDEWSWAPAVTPPRWHTRRSARFATRAAFSAVRRKPA